MATLTSSFAIDRAKVLPFTFDEKAHRYALPDGRRVLSATQILSAVGYVNYDMVPIERLEYKRQIGKLVHQACHFWDERKDDQGNPVSDEQMAQWANGLHELVRRRLEGYKKFRRDTGYQPHINEGQFLGCCYQMYYGMQFDSIGECAGRPWLVDIKNASGSPKRAWALQLASYALGVKPFSLVPPEQYVRVIVQLDDEGGYKLHTSQDRQTRIYQPDDFGIWPAVLATAIDLQNHGLLEAK